MDDTFSNLYKEFLAYADKGDEAGARKFLIDNMKSFPEEVQGKLLLASFEEAVMKEAEGMQEIAEVQKEGLNAMSQINKAKKVLADQAKIKSLKDKLNQ